MRIFTIGYEGATVGEFLAALQQAGVKRVIDVRAVPNSRRPGFSKTPLRNALAETGIDYVHLRALGTPADGRAAARAGRQKDLERIYAGQLELPEAIAEGAQMVDLAERGAERDPLFRARSGRMPPLASVGGGYARRRGRPPLRLTLVRAMSASVREIEGDDFLADDPSTRPYGLTVM